MQADNGACDGWHREKSDLGLPECDDILQQCTWQVAASDMMAAGLNYKERAEMLVQYVEALMELFPSCRAVVFDSSKKMFTREKLIRCRLPMESRFIYYAVNVRLFNIQGAEDMIVDSVGMSMLSLPDIQYHFHGVNPNAVVAHAYQILCLYFCFWSIRLSPGILLMDSGMDIWIPLFSGECSMRMRCFRRHESCWM